MADSLFKILLDKYLGQAITAEEKKQLFDMLHQPQYQQQLEQMMDGQLKENAFAIEEDDYLRQVIFKKIQQRKTDPVRKMMVWRRIAVAASILLIIGLGSYFAFFQKPRHTELVSVSDKDVKAPSSNRAMITLANGQVVYLDSAASGQLAQQGNIKLVKLANGQIEYNVSSEASPKGGGLEGAYNTLSNPRGSKVIDMQLADGSHVWLNAGSSIKYPIAFIGNERRVEITGEAYFEITHVKTGHALSPFIVSANNNADVTVLGTHFNVNAYDDESEIKVTLLEGSVRVQSVAGSRESLMIKPGEQAKAIGNGQLAINKNADIEEVMAWKNGKFVFGEKADIQTIMRQIARWYDVTVEYKGKVNGFIGGSISRDVNISNVLKMLEKTGEVKFIIEGNKITVLP